MSEKTRSAVQNALSCLFKQDSTGVFKSITCDNGIEFKQLADLETNHRKIYYAHSDASYERGTNEVHNGLLREYILKGKRIKGIEQSYIDEYATALNLRPRRILNFHTPYQVFHQKVETACCSV